MKVQLLRAFGGADRFEPADLPVPVPARGEVRVRVAALGVNGLECRLRAGQLQDLFPTPLPAVLGKEVAGTVDAVGPGTDGPAVGDRVVGFTGSGSYAQYCTARVEALAAVPDGVPFASAVTLPVAVETAARGLDSLAVRPGWTVVVNGASGPVGSAAVQLLRERGALVVGTASERNQAYVESLGARAVRYGDGAGERIRAAAPYGVDAVYDAAGHGFCSLAVELTGDPRRVVTIADPGAAALGVHLSTGSRRPVAAPFVPVLPRLAAGTFRTVVDRVYPLADMAAAHARVESGRAHGKVVVTVD
ncbi:NADP-dependent oxidoreductase [Streptomyces sp. NPDC001941]|uniref:quinone oxidoreductase family protein n=1 Tax=Streptomyces sp. NPDC001941 TaxID=3154659 RepID=UPI00332F09A7